MSGYCKCKLCTISVAKPKPGTANGTPETVSGNLIQLGPQDYLVHWSSRTFDKMMSTEIANIEKRGVNPTTVCASFYLYRNMPMPKSRPKQLELMDLGGNKRYVVKNDVTQLASIYLKSATGDKDPIPEVVVALGCGGFIEFSGENATRIVRTEPGA